MRNPLTASLAAMALHTGAALALGWPYPSVATFLAGMLGAVGGLVNPRASRRAIGGAASLAVFAPAVVPLPLLAAALVAGIAPLLPRADDPLPNVLVSLPALTLLVLGLTV